MDIGPHGHSLSHLFPQKPIMDKETETQRIKRASLAVKKDELLTQGAAWITLDHMRLGGSRQA